MSALEWNLYGNRGSFDFSSKHFICMSAVARFLLCEWKSVGIKCRIILAAVVAEWLRRLTRNQIPSGSVGSNPTDCEFFFFFSVNIYSNFGNSLLILNNWLYLQRWFSGRMLACHAGGPGSIPGRCNVFLQDWKYLESLAKLWRRRVSIPVPLAC